MRANSLGMGKLLLRHAGRRLWGESARAILLLAAVALGISVFVAVLYASDASVRSFRSSITSIGGEDTVEIRSHSGTISPGELAVIYPGLRRRFDTLTFWEARGEALGKSVAILAFDLSEASSRLDWPTEGGAGAPPTAAWWGSERALQRLGVSNPESTLSVLVSGRELTLPVRPLPERVEQRVSGDALFTTLGASAPLRESGGVTGVTLSPRAGTTALHIAALGQSLEGGGTRRLFLANPRQRATQAERLFAAFQLNIGVLVLMTLLVCAFIVFGAAQLSVLTLQRELGIMHTIGFSRPLLATVILSESFIVGCLGTALGLTTGRPITEWCANLFLKTVSVLYAGGDRPENIWGRSFAEVLALSLCVGVGLSVLGAIFPALRATNISPAIVARSKGIVVSTPSRWFHRTTVLCAICGALCASLAPLFAAAWSAHLAAFFVIGGVVGGAWWLLEVLAIHSRHVLARLTRTPGLLAAANVISGSRVVGVAVAANGVGLSLLIGLGVMVSSFRFTLADWVEYTIRGDLFIRSVEMGSFDRPARLPPDFESVATPIGGISGTIGFASFEFDTGLGFVTIGGQDFSSHPRARAFHLLSGRLSSDELAASDAVVISESASRKLGVASGDFVQLAGVSARVTGVFKDYSSEHGIVLFELSRFRRHFGPVPLTSAVVIVAEGGDVEAVARAFTESPIGKRISVQRNRELREVIFSIFDQTFQITDLMRFIVALICALGFVLTALQLHEERRHEIGTLLTLGLSRGGLQGSVFLEGLLMLVPGVVFGAIGGTALALILIYLVNPLSFGWTLTFVPTVGQYAKPILIVVGSNLFAAAFVAKRSAVAARKREVEDEL